MCNSFYLRNQETPASKRKKNDMAFWIESGFFFLFVVIFLNLNNVKTIPVGMAAVIYSLFIAVCFGWLLAYEFLFLEYDNAVHFKMFAKYYIPVPGANVKRNYHRQGLWKVVALWAAYLFCIYIIRSIGILSWQFFLAGMSFLFLLNSFFTRKLCLLSVLFLHNKQNCCKNCGINSWDYMIFASALPFAPKLSLLSTIVNWTFFSIGLISLCMWEYFYHNYPYRFYPDTNQSLRCSCCLKQCRYRKD